MTVRYIRKGQGKGPVLMGHAPYAVVGGGGGPADEVFFGGMRISLNSTFDPGGVNKSFSALQGEPMFFKYVNEVAQWAVWWPTTAGGPNPATGYNSFVEDVQQLSDGGCIVLITISNANSGAKTVQVQNADGSVFATLTPGDPDPHRQVDIGNARENHYIARYDTDGNCLWVKRFGNNTAGVNGAVTLTRGFGGHNILNINEAEGRVFVGATMEPQSGTTLVTMGAGFGEAGAWAYTDRQNRAAYAQLVFDLTNGDLQDYDFTSGLNAQSTNFGEILEAYNRLSHRDNLAGERLDGMIFRPGGIWTNPSPTNDLRVSQNGPGPITFVSNKPARGQANPSLFFTYYPVGNGAPAWTHHQLLLSDINQGLIDFRFFRSSARLGSTKVFNSINIGNVQLQNIDLQVKDGLGATSTKWSWTQTALTGDWHHLLISFDKTDGAGNFNLRHCYQLTPGGADTIDMCGIVLLDEARDLIVTRVRAGTAGTLRFNQGEVDQTDIAINANANCSLAFFRASTLDFLGFIQNSGVSATNQRPSVVGNELLWGVGIDASIANPTFDDGGPNQEAAPAPSANSAAFGYVRINLDTLQYVPGSYFRTFEQSFVGTLVSPFSFAYAGS